MKISSSKIAGRPQDTAVSCAVEPFKKEHKSAFPMLFIFTYFKEVLWRIQDANCNISKIV